MSPPLTPSHVMSSTSNNAGQVPRSHSESTQKLTLPAPKPITSLTKATVTPSSPPQPTTSGVQTHDQDHHPHSNSTPLSITNHSIPPPSQIIPGLYLSNMHTAAAYLTSQTHDTSGTPLPRITRILTIMSSPFSKYGYHNIDAPFPPCTRRKTITPILSTSNGIERMTIFASDTVHQDLTGILEEAVMFIREGVVAFQREREGCVVRGIMDRLGAVVWEDGLREAVEKGAERDRDAGKGDEREGDVTGAGLPSGVNKAFWASGTTDVTLLNVSGRTSTYSYGGARGNGHGDGTMDIGKRGTLSPLHAPSPSRIPFDDSAIRSRSHSRSHSPSATPQPKTPAPAPTTSGATLVHCHAGISRSATLVLAYLLRYHPDLIDCGADREEEGQGLSSGKRVGRMIGFARGKRRVVNPNWGFRGQLWKWVEGGMGGEN